MTVLFLLWWLVGIVASLHIQIRTNQKIFGRKYLDLEDVWFALVLGLAGLFALAYEVISIIVEKTYNRFKFGARTIIWEEKETDK